jgi:hypothetical protein
MQPPNLNKKNLSFLSVRQVGCGKGLVRQCLADMKAEEELETFFIEQIDQQVRYTSCTYRNTLGMSI